MNDRIFQIANKALIDASQADIEKLGELIVQECISIFNYDPNGEQSSFGEWSSNCSAVDSIRKHFGVK